MSQISQRWAEAQQYKAEADMEAAGMTPRPVEMLTPEQLRLIFDAAGWAESEGQAYEEHRSALRALAEMHGLDHAATKTLLGSDGDWFADYIFGIGRYTPSHGNAE